MTEARLEKSLDYLEARPVQLIQITPEILGEGRLYSSQPSTLDWVKIAKVKKAHDYNNGINRYRTKYPNVFSFSFEGRECFLVGNGNHRVADALSRGMIISCEKDANFGILDKKVIEDPRAARIRLAVYGIEGIWPFQQQLDTYKDVFNSLNNLIQ